MRISTAMIAVLAAAACGPKQQTAEKAADPHGGVAVAPLATPTPDPASSICGEVRLAPELAPRLVPGAVLFVFSKPQLGGGPPAAVVRRDPVSFPEKFCLSQKNSMAPGATFAGTQYVTARVEFDQNAGGMPGDLETVTREPVAVGTSDLVLTIDTVRQ